MRVLTKKNLIKNLKPIIKAYNVSNDNIETLISAQDDSPKVGYFWWQEEDGYYKLPLVVIFNIDEIDCMAYINHETIWKGECDLGYADGNFYDIPRGRVSWNIDNEKNYVYTGIEPVPNEELKSIIISAFKLPTYNVLWKYETFYNDLHNEEHNGGLIESQKYSIIKNACDKGYFDNFDFTLCTAEEGKEIEVVLKKYKNQGMDLTRIKSIKIFGDNVHFITPLFEMGMIEELEILRGNIRTPWPSSLENCTKLKSIKLDSSGCDNMPPWIQGLTELEYLSIQRSYIRDIPDWIGDLHSLRYLILKENKWLKSLPDSIGKLKNLVELDLRGSPVNKIPDTIINCTSLEFISKINDEVKKEIIPRELDFSYNSFNISYFILMDKIIKLYDLSRSIENPLSIFKREINDIWEYDFFYRGINIIFIDPVNPDFNKLLDEIEKEGNKYKKKLMEIAMLGIRGIKYNLNPDNKHVFNSTVADNNKIKFILLLNSMVDFFDNPIDIAVENYFINGDKDAFENLIVPDFEKDNIKWDLREALSTFSYTFDLCQIIVLLKKIEKVSKLALKQEVKKIKELLGKKDIKIKRIFDFGILLVVEGFEYDFIDKILTNMIDKDTHLARYYNLLCKEAVLQIKAEEKTEIIINNIYDLLAGWKGAYITSDLKKRIKEKEYYGNTD